MKFFTADTIFINNQFEREKIIVTSGEGEILDILNLDQIDISKVENVKGAIIPGLINTHCHLELSHMKGRVETGTHLLPFLINVVTYRNFAQEVIEDAIEKADAEMYANGIVAVGDISNKTDTVKTKNCSKIAYYTFVENFDFLSENRADETFENYLSVYEQQSALGQNKKSMVPHAPYTVSQKLFKLINTFNPNECTVSVHNQETKEENLLFLNKSGGFIEFFKRFGSSLDGFDAIGKNSIYYLLENMNLKNKTIFVHNTMTNEEDILAAQSKMSEVYWATCPNANLYIENRLPDYKTFIDCKANVTIGTDSLTSNWQLSVMEEIYTIRKYCSYVPLELCLTWATANGARALGYTNFGSIEIGKKPGLVQADITWKGNGYFLNSASVRRLI